MSFEMRLERQAGILEERRKKNYRSEKQVFTKEHHEEA